ncbi:VOC family protein [Actinotalea fermentans]|uniref:Glycosylase n=1 Tax=Actinotalea fermentans TaxID=43671 RepID=A0A511Z2A0_9CELL|nr:VOC family protein [Actinotalea fermentans]KGM15393.1 hypothetical protein N867_09005 [Actinotalea fermentans ATCC 43279 = JCM 9966 = DSM 3133]GEN81582.1 glycosylase [Actinotalea fermentans]
MTLTPYLTVHDGVAALAYYAAAFGAREEGERYVEGDGRIGHATLVIGEDVLFVSDEFQEFGAYSPATVGHATGAVVLEVGDVDRVYAAAIAAGGTADREPSGEPGAREGWLVDPFGHRWALRQARA